MPKKRELLKEISELTKYINLRQYGTDEVSINQLNTLLYIKDKGCVKPTDLSKEFNITPATVTIQIDRLERNGWVERVKDCEDKRVKSIKLSSSALNKIDRIVEKSIDKYKIYLESLTEKEQEEFFNILRKIKEQASKLR